MSSFDATYISANSFSVPGDVRYYFLPNIAVTVECGGVWVFSYVESATYSTDTTVVLKTSVLSAPCGNAEVGIHPYMIPWHPHDESTNSGGDEVLGAPPSHEWNGTQIRFRYAYGEWGEWVDLVGPATEFTGPWSDSSVSYLSLNIVTNDGSSYLCVLAHTSGASTEPGIGVDWETYWALLAPKGDQGDQGIQGIQGIQGEIGPQGNQGPQGIQGIQGESGIIGTWLGAWETPYTYVASDAVSNDGSSYICILGHESDATTEPGTGTYWTTYWELVASKGDQGAQGTQGIQGIQGIQGDSGLIGTWLGDWETPYGYVETDCVENDGSSYICIDDHTSDASTEPGVGVYWTSYWELVAQKGEPGINWIEGGWQTSTPYVALDAVSNDSSSYICILGHTSDATTEPGTGAYWATYWEVLAEAGVGGGGGGVLTGTFASRPAAGTSGRMYITTNGGYSDSVDNGSSWDAFREGFKCSVPSAGDFTQVSGGAETTFVDDGDGILMTQMGTASTASTYVGFLQALPSAPYSMTLGMQILRMPLTNSVIVGLILTNGTDTSAEIITHTLSYTSSALYEIGQKFNNWTTWSANYYLNAISVGLYPYQAGRNFFFRIRDDNTYRYFETSVDGRNWYNVYPTLVSRTDFITPTHGGILVAQTGTSVAATIIRSQSKINHFAFS
jgi:hypothetical protein